MAQVYQLSPAFSVLYYRLIVASKDADEARREKAVAENLMDELRKRCSSLEKEKCEVLEKVKESIEAVNIAKMQTKQVILFFGFSLQIRHQLFQLLIFFFIPKLVVQPKMVADRCVFREMCHPCITPQLSDGLKWF